MKSFRKTALAGEKITHALFPCGRKQSHNVDRHKLTLIAEGTIVFHQRYYVDMDPEHVPGSESGYGSVKTIFFTCWIKMTVHVNVDTKLGGHR